MAKALVKEEGDLDFLSLEEKIDYLSSLVIVIPWEQETIWFAFVKDNNLEKAGLNFDVFFLSSHWIK